jgi:hypothetical protein
VASAEQVEHRTKDRSHAQVISFAVWEVIHDRSTRGMPAAAAVAESWLLLYCCTVGSLGRGCL